LGLGTSAIELKELVELICDQDHTFERVARDVSQSPKVRPKLHQERRISHFRVEVSRTFKLFRVHSAAPKEVSEWFVRSVLSHFLADEAEE